MNKNVIQKCNTKLRKSQNVSQKCITFLRKSQTDQKDRTITVRVPESLYLFYKNFGKRYSEKIREALIMYKNLNGNALEQLKIEEKKLQADLERIRMLIAHEEGKIKEKEEKQKEFNEKFETIREALERQINIEGYINLLRNPNAVLYYSTTLGITKEEFKKLIIERYGHD